MDEEIAKALSRLFLVSGGPSRAKEYLEAYINQGESQDLSSVSTPSLSSVSLQAAADLPPLSPPATNPWREGDGAPIDTARSAGPFPHFGIASPDRGARSHTKYRDGTKHYVRSNYGLTEGSPTWEDGRSSAPFSLATTPIQPRYNRTQMPETPNNPQPFHTHRTPSPYSSVSMSSGGSDQPLSAGNPPLTPNWESGSSNKNRNLAVSLPSSPAKLPRTPGPVRDSGGLRISSLHPDLAAIRRAESRLSKKDFEAVKSKIQADPDYVGESPYIKVQNPQYAIKCIVHAPPKSGSGKWYSVSRGTAVGVFNAWGPTAGATQGVALSIFKSHGTRGAAIVAYQVDLLKGAVCLMNTKEEEGRGEEEE